ncbi:hypothetical protein VB779_06620 [Haloarculaceae archaeon H-GB11]|nr:hypothetical protein [Haloarculaceae archaeon H-GB11]
MGEIEPVYPTDYSVACYSVVPTADFEIDDILQHWPNTPDRSANGWYINRYNDEVEYKQVGPFEPPDRLDDNFASIYILAWERWTGWTELLTIGVASDEYLSSLRRRALQPDAEDYLPGNSPKRQFSTHVRGRLGFDTCVVIGRVQTQSKPKIKRIPKLDLDENLFSIVDGYIEAGALSGELENQSRIQIELQKQLLSDFDISSGEAESLGSLAKWIRNKQISLSHIGIPTYDYAAILGRQIYIAASTVDNGGEGFPREIETIELRSPDRIHSQFELDWLDPYVFGISPYLAWYFIPDMNIGEIGQIRSELTSTEPFSEISLDDPNVEDIINGQESLEEFLLDWRSFYPKAREAVKISEEIQDEMARKSHGYTHLLPLTKNIQSESDYAAETLPSLFTNQCKRRVSQFNSQLSRLSEEYNILRK